MSRSGLAALLAAAAAVAAGCGGGAEHANKAGGSAPPVVLRMADGYNPALELEPAVAYFVRRVRELSKGQLRIKVIDNWAGTTPEFEQEVVRASRQVRPMSAGSGRASSTRMGVNSFQALTAPMLIDNYRLERAVIGSGIPARMLSGLERLGVAGLACSETGCASQSPSGGPSCVRPIGAGQLFGSSAPAAKRAIRSLGARTTDIWGPALQDAAGEHKYRRLRDELFPLVVVIDPSSAPIRRSERQPLAGDGRALANPHRLSKLSGSQQGWLSQASADAARDPRACSRTRSTHHRLCGKEHVSTVRRRRPRGDASCLRAGLRPLEQDPRRGLHPPFEQLKRKTRREATPRSHRAAPVQRTIRSAADRATDRSVLNGIYRVSLDDQELKASGPIAAFSRRSFGGVITLTLRTAAFAFTPDAAGMHRAYTVSANAVRFRFHPHPTVKVSSSRAGRSAAASSASS